MAGYNRVLNLDDPKANELFLAVGYASTCWAQVESSLGFLFIAMATPDPAAFGLLAAFDSVVSLDVRMTQLRAAGIFYFRADGVRYGHFNAFLEKVEGAAKQRNKIMHGVVVRKSQAGLPDRYRIVPHVLTSKGIHLPRLTQFKYQLTAADVLGSAEHFKKLSDAGFTEYRKLWPLEVGGAPATFFERPVEL